MRRLLHLSGILAVLALPVVFDASAVRLAASLHELGAQPSPYWQPSHALLLYVRVPMVVMSAMVLVLSPGLLVAATLPSARSPGRWLLAGFSISLVTVSVVAAVVQALLRSPLTGGGFEAVVALCALAGAAIAFARARRNGADGRVVPAALLRGAAGIILPALPLVAGLVPKFFWESFNGDGAQSFECARLLLSQGFPFWPADAGAIASFPGITSMLFTYPGSWFVRLFGPVEAAARLPFVLYLSLLVAAIGELIRTRREDGRAPWVMIWCTLGGYILAMAFSATYSPYSADIALPATQDTLLMVCFLAFVQAFVRAERGWMIWWGALTYLSLPSGVVLIGFWIVAAFISIRPRPWSMIRTAAATLAAAVVLGAVVGQVLPLLGMPSPGGEYGLAGIFRYFAFLQVTDWRRLLYIAAPAGALPVLATLMWQRQDGTSRALTLVAWAYFLFFYVQGHIALHHFVPAMLLPVVVFWRMLPLDRRRAVSLWALPTAVAGLLLSTPTRWTPELQSRVVGSTVAERIGGYGQSRAREFRGMYLLSALFPFSWDPSVPDRSYGGSPLAWNAYARRDSVTDHDANYLLAPIGVPVPAGWLLVRRDDSAAVYVRDLRIWAAQRAYRPAGGVGAPLLRVPRWMLFEGPPPVGGPRMLDVPAMLGNARRGAEAFLRRLGVQR